MNIELKKQQLFKLYEDFARIARPYMASAVCRKGCADCCTTVGNIDVTTLEGFSILKHLKTLPPDIQKDFVKKLKQNRKTKQDRKFVRCVFLRPDNTCSIYELRPFSCRRLYSIRLCGNSGPTVHRQVWEAAERIRFAIQQLDSTGYMGHISFILQLLNDRGFLKTYLSGEFRPEDIHSFGMSHKIFINRLAKPPNPV